MSERTPPPPPIGTRPPPSDASTPRGVVLRGIAGSPGVANVVVAVEARPWASAHFW